jgi:hypothetical protein
MENTCAKKRQQSGLRNAAARDNSRDEPQDKAGICGHIYEIIETAVFLNRKSNRFRNPGYTLQQKLSDKKSVTEYIHVMRALVDVRTKRNKHYEHEYSANTHRHGCNAWNFRNSCGNHCHYKTKDKLHRNPIVSGVDVCRTHKSSRVAGNLAELQSGAEQNKHNGQ